jgi:hypothetical protein
MNNVSTEFAMVEKTSSTAIIALCISIATAAFSIYQWWYSQQDLKIIAAVDISRKYQDIEKSLKNRQELLSYARNEPVAYTPEIVKYLQRLEYIAYLVIYDRIDLRYLAPDIKCDMLLSARAGARVRKGNAGMADSKLYSERLAPNIEHVTGCEF